MSGSHNVMEILLIKNLTNDRIIISVRTYFLIITAKGRSRFKMFFFFFIKKDKTNSLS